MANIPPAIHGKNCSVEYVLNANVKYEIACSCDAKVPSISVPMTIIPLVDPSRLGFPEP